jgi:predicted cobalt transporter CbtA
MLGSFIRRGVIAGLAGGAASALFLLLVGERTIGDAIHLEEQHGGGGDAMFTRGTQVFGGALGVILVSIALGVIFATTFAAVRHRLPGRNDWQRSITWAATAFVVVYLVPFLKYPPNPPAVGQADTIRARTGWYLVMVLASVVLAVAAVWLARRLAARLGAWEGGLLAAGTYLVAIVGVGILLPNVDETPGPLREDSGAIVYPGFPADVLYEFRLVSLATQLVLWATIGLVFATLARRPLEERVLT